jgi:hypothetical protein
MEMCFQSWVVFLVALRCLNLTLLFEYHAQLSLPYRDMNILSVSHVLGYVSYVS